MRTFEEIAEAQGWDVFSQLDLLRQYVANQGDEAALSAFAENSAAVENQFAEHTVNDEHAFEASAENRMYCQHCGASETDHRL